MKTDSEGKLGAEARSSLSVPGGRFSHNAELQQSDLHVRGKSRVSLVGLVIVSGPSLWVTGGQMFRQITRAERHVSATVQFRKLLFDEDSHRRGSYTKGRLMTLVHRGNFNGYFITSHHAAGI